MLLYFPPTLELFLQQPTVLNKCILLNFGMLCTALLVCCKLSVAGKFYLHMKY